MPQLNDIEEILFPVQEVPVYACINYDQRRQWLPAPRKKAIINTRTRQVLGIVSQSYRLISNQEALSLAHQCCQAVFPETKPTEWEVSGVDAPTSYSFCTIDLKHASNALDFRGLTARERPEVYGPYIRVTNSYNGQRAMKFDIGFMRKVCSNGMIAPRSAIRFSYSHSDEDVNKAIKFSIEKGRFEALRQQFLSFLTRLQECRVLRPQFEPLINGVLQLRKRKSPKANERVENDWRNLTAHVTERCDHYSNELGENAYAAMNVMTDLASNPPDNNVCLFRDRHGYQTIVGQWAAEFGNLCKQSGFDLDKYIADLSNGKNPAAGRSSRRQS